MKIQHITGIGVLEMGDLILYLCFAVVGYIAGSKVRHVKEKLWWTGKIQTACMMLLIVLMGSRMGSNEEIISNLSTIGLSALIMTIAILAGSVGAVYIVRKMIGLDRFGTLQKTSGIGGTSEPGGESGESLEVQKAEDDQKKQGLNTMTILIVIAIAIGMLFGYFVIRTAFAENMADFDRLCSLGIKIGLCILLTFVGLDLGLDGTVIDNFKSVGFRVFLIPIATVAGTLGAAFVMSFFLKDLTLRETLAIGAGFGWYSLAPGIIMDAGHMTASAVCFLHNVMREMLAILIIPSIAKYVGYVETVSLPGAAAMDVCLPVVEKSTKSEIAVYSFISGLILSALVPVLVPIIIG